MKAIVTPAKAELCDQCGLSVSDFILSISRITAKVIGRFHWNLLLWLGLPIARSD